MGAIASPINILTMVYSTVYSDADKKTIKLRVTGLCAGNSPGASECMASNAENVSIWWRHHENETFFPKQFFENVVCKMPAILLWPKCIKSCLALAQTITAAIMSWGPLLLTFKVPTALEKSMKFRSVLRSWKNHWIWWKVLEICKNEKIMEKSLNFGSVAHGKIIEFWNRHSFD